jgi:hypothetical protein
MANTLEALVDECANGWRVTARGRRKEPKLGIPCQTLLGTAKKLGVNGGPLAFKSHTRQRIPSTLFPEMRHNGRSQCVS